MQDATVESLVPHDTQLLMRTLRDVGFRVLFRTNGWVECLVSGDDESWVGSGPDEEAALRSALRAMLPSKLACVAFDALLDSRSVLVQREQTVAEIVSSVDVPSSGAPLLFPVTPVVEAEPEVEPEPAPPTVIELPESFGFEEPEPRATLPTVHVEPITIETRPPQEPIFSLTEAFERLEDIMQEIKEERADLGLMTASHQRLHIAAWVFRARSVQEVWPRNREVERAVHDIALKLTDLCKRYWPGSVRALQLATSPTQALEGLSMGPAARTWTEASERIEQRIASALSMARDEWGWLDKIKCLPPDPEAVLEEAISKIESVVGPIDLPVDTRRLQTANNVMEDAMEEFVLAAHLLRWTRSSDVDGMRWGTAMGVLRWVAYVLGRGTHPLREVIDERFVPNVDWAALLGRDPQLLREKALRRSVMSTIPTTSSTRDELCRWLESAFAIFTNPQIATMAKESGSAILDLSAETFANSDRNVRSRLRRLQEILRRGVEIPAALPDVEPLAPGDEQAEEILVRSAAEILLERVRPRTQGKRILFVTNREDDALQERLQEDLGCSVTVRDGGTDRKVQHLVAAVSPGTYDMVLVATSFISHKLDTTMSRLAKQLGIPYVRVNKGRPVATVRALARLFSVDKSTA